MMPRPGSAWWGQRSQALPLCIALHDNPFNTGRSLAHEYTSAMNRVIRTVERQPIAATRWNTHAEPQVVPCAVIILAVVRAVGRLSLRMDDFAVSETYGLASRTILKGVSVARWKRVKPPLVTTSRNFASPAWAPNPRPTSWLREVGRQIMVEAA